LQKKKKQVNRKLFTDEIIVNIFVRPELLSVISKRMQMFYLSNLNLIFGEDSKQLNILILKMDFT